VWRRIHCTPPEYICSIYSQIINEYILSLLEYILNIF
jgi:hypothetical protein